MRAKSINDNAVPSGNSVALQVLDQLWNRTGEFRYRKLFTRTAAAMAGRLNQYPTAGAYALSAISARQAGETGTLLYFAEGHIRARLLPDNVEHQFKLELSIDKGWHINADTVLQKELIPTSVKSASSNWQVEHVQFPPAKEIELSFQEQALKVLHGEVTLEGSARRNGDTASPLRLQLTLQACDDSHCLAPQTGVLAAPVK